ncbi:ras-domain-containing protein [Hymenopellis radicata]|nr:ras-domain-containing protein [Hymenopellis radicata]
MQHAVGVHGYSFVYSLQSFEVIQTVYDKLCHVSGVPEIPCVIVGSKSDLRSSRQVTASDGKALAAANNAAFIETSSKDNTNVARAFELCLDEIEKRLPGNQTVAPDHRCLLM